MRDVKSAARAMALLEHFTATRRSATVGELSSALQIPQSSASMLISTLESMGYLAEDASGAYFPTLRVQLLGHWLRHELPEHGDLVLALDQLRRETGHTTLIGARYGNHVRVLYVLWGESSSRIQILPGALYPVCQSAMGKMLLTLEGDKEIEQIASSNCAETISHASWKTILSEVQIARAMGWAASDDYPFLGRGAIATLLPEVPNQPRMAVALGLPMADLHYNRNALLEALVQFTNSASNPREH